MSVERGRDWGEPRPLPDDGLVVRSDLEARRVVEEARRAGTPLPVLGLLGGDLCRTLGGRGDEGRLRSEEAYTLPVDLGTILVDGLQHWFVAHAVARRGWLRGPVWVAANAAFLGSWNVAPRAHPGDGRLDVVAGDPGLGDRLKARSRLPSGTHVPHPALTVRRVRATQLDLDRPTPIRLDGEIVARRARALSVRVEAAALRVVV